jgi:hypothetical protein
MEGSLGVFKISIFLRGIERLMMDINSQAGETERR